MVVSEGKLQLKDQEQVQKINLAIDTFFESLAVAAKEKAIAIVLSGTGSDGTRGSRSVKESGGIVIAQDEQTARFNGMPRSVISTNICDYIMAPKYMPEELMKYAGQPASAGISRTVGAEDKPDENNDVLSSICNIIRKRYQVDFKLYKLSTVLRCIDRRMRMNQIQEPEMYLELLKESPEETERLYSSFLIGVTRFFRDEEAFNIIKNKVVPEIIRSKPDSSTIRVWVAGCSTGEEAYSLAILFKEHMDAIQRNINIKIFATDIDNNAIAYASEGIYPDSISHDVSLERLNRYFIKKREVYQVPKAVREMVIFSTHNVISNPPFFKIDLLSCRNLLIYFQPVLQTRILSTFQFAIETNGFMFLGNSETTGELGKYFSTVDAKWKIFRCRESKKCPLIDDISVISSDMKLAPVNTQNDYLMRKVRNSWEMDEIYAKLIEEILPPCVVVDESGELVQVCRDADRFLKIPRGRAYYDIQKMVPKELSTALGTVMSKVKKEKKVVIYTNIKVKLTEGVVCVNLIVKPLVTKKNGPLVLVLFEEVKNPVPQGEYEENYDTINKLHERIADLEQELQYTKESLQTSIEEIETSSEEIQSANEELLVSNEELHSTNEELQSVNEELIVVNTQYQYKIQELADLNDDMTNFLNSTTIGTIFLDSNLSVRKFTPAVTREINLIESDIGRPISHMSHNLTSVDLIGEARNVMQTLIPSEQEVQSSSGRYYLLKYAPYRTNDNIIKGVVISLVDISSRKAAELSLGKSNKRYEKLVEMAPFAILVLKDDLIEFINTEGMKLLQARTAEQLIGKSIGKYININGELLHKYQEEAARCDADRCFMPEEKIIRADGSVIYVEIMSMPINFDDEDTLLLILRDITFKRLSEQLQEDNIRTRRLLEEAKVFDGMKNDFFSNLFHELRTPLNVIMSTLQLLQSMDRHKAKSETDQSRKRYMDIMKQNCFRQVDKSMARGQEGSGIGLSLVKSLVEMHGGKISVRSEYGNGSEFIIDLPDMTVEDAEVPVEEVKPQNNVEKIHLEFSDIYNLN